MSSACLSKAFAGSRVSDKTLPMPTYWAPCPGNKRIVLDMGGNIEINTSGPLKNNFVDKMNLALKNSPPGRGILNKLQILMGHQCIFLHL
jgi:hypothetical protein